MGKNKEKLRDLWNTIKWINIHIIGVPERKKWEKGTESLFKEMIAENFPNLGKKTDIQIQGSQRVPVRLIQRDLYQNTS